MTPEQNAVPERYFFGPYEILETLGRGGMGVVYRAHDRALGRDVALKILRDDLRGEARVLARFRREAETFARLDHPNIVHVHSVGAIDNIPYIAMQYIEGETLANRLRRNGPMPWQEALRIGLHVAEALASAHAAQVIHRDIKPGNILLGDDDGVHVTDFGIAKVLNAATQLTIDGSRLGTPQYMCPERCRNQEITPSSDLYSLGVVLFQSITGKLPYSARSSVELIDKITGETPARAGTLVSGLPDSVERLLAWLLEKTPARRPAGATALAEAIQRVLDGKPLDAGKTTMGHALEGYRRALPKEEPATPSPALPRRSAAMHRKFSRRAARAWYGLPRWARLMAAAVGVLAVAAGLLAVAAPLLLKPRPVVERLSESRHLARWEAPLAVATLTQESASALIGQLDVPGHRISGLMPGAGNTMLIATSDGGAQSLLGVDLDVASIVPLSPPSAPARPMRLLASLPGARTGIDTLLYTSDVDTRAVARAHSVPSGLGYLPGERVFNGPASSASLPYWTGQAWAVAVAATRGGHHDWQVFSYGGNLRGDDAVLAPPGAPIEAVSIASDGAALLFLRKGVTAQELWWKRAGEAPILLDEGELAMTQRALSPSGDAAVYEKSGVIHLRAPQGKAETWPGTDPQWLPDGLGIAYLAQDALQRRQVQWVRPGQSLEPESLTHLETGVGDHFAISADGSHIVAPLPDGERFVVTAMKPKDNAEPGLLPGGDATHGGIK